MWVYAPRMSTWIHNYTTWMTCFAAALLARVAKLRRGVRRIMRRGVSGQPIAAPGSAVPTRGQVHRRALAGRVSRLSGGAGRAARRGAGDDAHCASGTSRRSQPWRSSAVPRCAVVGRGPACQSSRAARCGAVGTGDRDMSQDAYSSFQNTRLPASPASCRGLVRRSAAEGGVSTWSEAGRKVCVPLTPSPISETVPARGRERGQGNARPLVREMGGLRLV